MRAWVKVYSNPAHTKNLSLFFPFYSFVQGIVRDNGGHAVALRWSMWNVYGVNPGEVSIWIA